MICTHVGPVNRKIEELIGLNSEQFHKIVLLPQGEFRRFLSDRSDEKQEILRHIFSTGILSSFTERLKQGVSSCTAAYQNTLSHCAALLHTIQTEAGSPLACSITANIPDFSAVLSLLSDQNQTDKAALEKTTEQLRSAAAAYDCINLELCQNGKRSVGAVSKGGEGICRNGMPK